MKAKKLFSVFIVLALLMAVLPVMSAGATPDTLYVDANGTCDGNSPCYLHPQDAVNAANPGDTILVYPGTYDSRYFVCDLVHPTWCAPNDNWAPALIVFKDGLTIKSVEGPANTIIQSTHYFWSNAIAVQNSTAGGIVGVSSWSPNAITIVANNVTIDGFTLHRPFDGTWATKNTAGVFIGSKASGYADFLGHANGATVQNNIFSDVWHAVYIWHSSGNEILHNTVAALNTDHWAAISTYDGYDDAGINLGNLSENNLIAFNTLANKGIAVGAWAPPTWTSAAQDVVACNTTTQVGVTYAHGPVLAGGNTGNFWQSNTDKVLNVTGISYTGDTGVFPSGTLINLKAQLVYDGSSGDGSGVNVTFTLDGTTYTATTVAGGVASMTATLPVGVYDVGATVTIYEGCAFTSATQFLVVYDATAGFVTGGGWIDLPEGAVAPIENIAYFNGFETDIEGWYTPNRVATGSNGIPSATGGYHAEAMYGDYTDWGGYNSVFPAGGFITSIDIYLDMEAGYTNDTRFDWTSAINTPNGDHRRDFVFTGGFYDDATGPGAGLNRFVFSASNNTPGWPKNPGRDPIAVSTTGWYTLQHRFYDSGASVLAVDMSILDSSGNVIHTWTSAIPRMLLEIQSAEIATGGL